MRAPYHLGRRTLVLVPTELERRIVLELGGLDPTLARIELAGFGPIAAAARTMQLLASLLPRRVLLIGIAGAYRPERHPSGSALGFARVALDGVGAGAGEGARSAAQLGFPHWPGSADTTGGPVGETLDLEPRSPADGALLLTVSSASDSSELALARRARYPEAAAEDMEGFAVALACALERVPLSIVRGISNAAGERDTRRWDVRGALRAARELALEVLQREPEAGP
jgi:futalosine hydrolase